MDNEKIIAVRIGQAVGAVSRPGSQAGMLAVSPFVLAAPVLAVVGGFVGLAYWRRWEWTGLPAAHDVGEDGAVERPAKTLWDWLQLLGIPVVLATLAFLLNEAQSSRELQREDQRAARQRRSAADTERENTLRTYLAQMSDLMLDRRLLRSKSGADVRKVARTATLTAVRRLDGARRGLVVQFLAEARLLGVGMPARAAVLVASADLSEADLSGAFLIEINLRKANLRRAHLIGTDLNGADLRGADLRGAHLREAHLREAHLREANLRDAGLIGANLARANLFRVQLPGAHLREAHLHGAILREADLIGADLRGADLRGADLHEANLTRADLRGTDLRGAFLIKAGLIGADLRRADLRGADLLGADFRGARGVDLTNTKGEPAYGP
jgi:uncharacterized protein YjbI with pentapeptide repeats